MNIKNYFVGAPTNNSKAALFAQLENGSWAVRGSSSNWIPCEPPARELFASTAAAVGHYDNGTPIVMVTFRRAYIPGDESKHIPIPRGMSQEQIRAEEERHLTRNFIETDDTNILLEKSTRIRVESI